MSLNRYQGEDKVTIDRNIQNLEVSNTISAANDLLMIYDISESATYKANIQTTISSGSATTFASGTKMIFKMASAPTGWTRDTTIPDQCTLRYRSSASVSNGGAENFSNVYASHSNFPGSVTISPTTVPTGPGSTGSTTLTEAQMAPHNHGTNLYSESTFNIDSPIGAPLSVTGPATASFDVVGPASKNRAKWNSTNNYPAITPGGHSHSLSVSGSHTHTPYTWTTATSWNLAIKYVYAIVCTKN